MSICPFRIVLYKMNMNKNTKITIYWNFSSTNKYVAEALLKGTGYKE